MSKGTGRRPAYAKVITSGRPINPARGSSARSNDDLMTKIGRRVEVIADCWVIDGQIDVYATAGTRTRRGPAHRLVYSEVNEVTVPDGVHIHHTCEHPGCVRPDHLVALDAGDHRRLHAGMVELDDVMLAPDVLAEGAPPLTSADRIH